MITRGFGKNSFLISRGFGFLSKIIVEIIKIFSEFYNRIILRTIIKSAENINLKTLFSYNILLKSNINLIQCEQMAIHTVFNNKILLNSKITLKRI